MGVRRVRRRNGRGGLGTIEFDIAYIDRTDNTACVFWYLVKWDGKRNRSMVRCIEVERVGDGNEDGQS